MTHNPKPGMAEPKSVISTCVANLISNRISLAHAEACDAKSAWMMALTGCALLIICSLIAWALTIASLMFWALEIHGALLLICGAIVHFAFAVLSYNVVRSALCSDALTFTQTREEVLRDLRSLTQCQVQDQE